LTRATRLPSFPRLIRPSRSLYPRDVPVYEWVDGEPQPRKLIDFQRTPLVTYYLAKQGEPKYHLVNEPFDYHKIKT